MLSVARHCFRATRGSGAFITNNTFCSPLRVQSFNLSSALFKQSPKQFAQINNVFRKSGTVALNFGSKVSNKSQKLVGAWFMTCGGMVFMAVVLGGITRLTESGLSMVTWRLLGEKMPISETDWIIEFEKYKEYPEYKMLNNDMTLEQFKRIWYMEYAHRMWGRLIGAVFLGPAGYFWAKGYLTKGQKVRVGIFGSLIALQGLMGWYMVKSGLEERFDGPSDVPRVSQYRLASHLGLALVLYTGFLYSALDILAPAQKVAVDIYNHPVIKDGITKGIKTFKILVHSTKGLIFLTALSGAFVAGLDAGLIYNTFPKMADQWVPDEILALRPAFKNFTENPVTVQFDHRVLGITTLTLISLVALKSRKLKLPGRSRAAIFALLVAGYAQATIGISTLINQVPIDRAAAHQSGSLVLLSAIIWLCHELKHMKKFIRK